MNSFHVACLQFEEELFDHSGFKSIDFASINHAIIPNIEGKLIDYLCQP